MNICKTIDSVSLPVKDLLQVKSNAFFVDRWYIFANECERIHLMTTRMINTNLQHIYLITQVHNHTIGVAAKKASHAPAPIPYKIICVTLIYINNDA